MTDRTFNLDEILGEKDVAHYLRFITPTADNIYGDASYRYGASQIPAGGRLSYDDEPASDTTWTARAWKPEDDIERRGSGADVCSSSFELASPADGFVWDVCEYYRLLGVHWTAAKLEMTSAYLRKSKGTVRTLPRTAYALKQLMNPLIRRLYDRATPDKPFLLDNWTAEALKRKAIQQAARESAELGIEVTDEEVLSRWGMKRNKQGEEQSPEELAKSIEASSSGRGQGTFGQESTALGSTISAWQLQWSWYAWHDADLESGYWSPRSLEAWQRHLRHELAAAGLAIRFAVGLHGGPGWKLFQTSEGVCIFFLGRGEYPDEELAAQAVDYMSSRHAQGRSNRHANEKGFRGSRARQ